MALLSVVTPVFNSASYISEALDSVAAIRYPHEHIVVDGGSTDGTLELLERRGDPTLRWISEPDRGQTDAVNKGLAMASGTLLGWLNADDAYVPEAVDRALGQLERRPATKAVYGGLDFTDATGTVCRSYRPAPWSWRRYLLLGDYVPTPTILFRRELVERHGVLDGAWADAADYDFYLRLLRGARVDVMDEALVRFRYHAGSKTARDVWLQQDEALAIRLRWARNGLDSAVMRGFDRSKRAILPRISAWPRPYPRPPLLRALDAAGRAFESIAPGR